MKKYNNDRRFRKRTKTVSARITEEDYEIIKKNNTTVGSIIEEYIDTRLNIYAQRKYNLRKLEEQLAEKRKNMKKEKEEEKVLIKEIKELKKEVNYVESEEIDGLEFPATVLNIANGLARNYLKNSFKYTDFEEYLQENEVLLNQRALENKLSFNDFCDLVRTEKEKVEKENEAAEQEKQRAELECYANVSANISEAALIELSKAVRAANNQIKAHKFKYPSLEDYLKVNQNLIDTRVAECDLSRDEFVELMREAYGNLERG